MGHQCHWITNLIAGVSEVTLSYMSMSVPGLHYCPQFISSLVGDKLVTLLRDSQAWVGVTASQTSRRVIHYGYTYSYQRGPLTTADPIPADFQELLSLVNQHVRDTIDPDFTGFDQLIINEYVPGQGIAAHVDHVKYFGPIIACVSVGHGIAIDFSKQGDTPVTLYVEANSLYAMSDAARYVWKHGINKCRRDCVEGQTIPRGTRYSLTFRQVIRA